MTVSKNVMQSRIQHRANAAARESRLAYLDKKIAYHRQVIDNKDNAEWVIKVSKSELEKLLPDRQRVLDTPVGESIPGDVTSASKEASSLIFGGITLVGLIWGIGACFSGLGASNVQWGIDRCNGYLTRRASGENIVLSKADQKMCNSAWGLTPEVYN